VNAKLGDQPLQIKDHVFIVTGASSGIGLSTAMALSDRGAKVALLARSGDALQRLAQQLPGSLPVTADMAKFDRVREAVRTVHRHYGRIDGLVNNAGRSYAASIEEIEPEIFERNLPSQCVGANRRDAGSNSGDASPSWRKHREHQFGDCVHDYPSIQRLLGFEARASWLQSHGTR
jgi:hypothetical protein